MADWHADPDEVADLSETDFFETAKVGRVDRSYGWEKLIRDLAKWSFWAFVVFCFCGGLQLVFGMPS